MAFNLISCNNLYPSITGVLSPDFTSNIGSVVEIGNPTQSYTVESDETTGVVDLGAITITQIDSCVPCVNFDSIISVTSDCCTCSSIKITDSSKYVNSLPGLSSFGYRRVVVTSPFGTEYVFSSNEDESPDGIIDPYSIGGQTEFNYLFTENDVDGVYSVKFYTFPHWDATVNYNSIYNHIVFQNGKLYKSISTGTNHSPELDLENIYWVEYLISDETLNTRYADIKHEVVLCISLESCGDKLMKDAFCGTQSNPCGGLCENKKFQQAMKYQVSMKALRLLAKRKDWNGVNKAIELLKNICSCGGC